MAALPRWNRNTGDQEIKQKAMFHQVRKAFSFYFLPPVPCASSLRVIDLRPVDAQNRQHRGYGQHCRNRENRAISQLVAAIRNQKRCEHIARGVEGLVFSKLAIESLRADNADNRIAPATSTLTPTTASKRLSLDVRQKKVQPFQATASCAALSAAQDYSRARLHSFDLKVTDDLELIASNGLLGDIRRSGD
jgi:hypothetical protein